MKGQTHQGSAGKDCGKICRGKEVLNAEDVLTKAQYQEIRALHELNVLQAYLNWAAGL